MKTSAYVLSVTKLILSSSSAQKEQEYRMDNSRSVTLHVVGLNKIHEVTIENDIQKKISKQDMAQANRLFKLAGPHTILVNNIILLPTGEKSLYAYNQAVVAENIALLNLIVECYNITEVVTLAKSIGGIPWKDCYEISNVPMLPVLVVPNSRFSNSA